MGYRIVEIAKPSECHVSHGQLVVEQEEATFQIPIEDIEILICIGAKVRFCTMELGELNKAGIIVPVFGKKHEIETIIELYFLNQRHSSILKIQNCSF